MGHEPGIYFLGLPCMKNPQPIVAGGQTLGAIRLSFDSLGNLLRD